VAVPIQAARGIIANAEVIKINEDPQPKKCPATETGININKIERIFLVFSMSI
jgi:hypothetical protein